MIDLKENKTPGSENCLDPPGAELLAWPEIGQANRRDFSACSA